MPIRTVFVNPVTYDSVPENGYLGSTVIIRRSVSPITHYFTSPTSWRTCTVRVSDDEDSRDPSVMVPVV